MYDVINSSFIAGIAQTLIGHPFDTIKTCKQIEYKKSSMKIMENLVKKNSIFFFLSIPWIFSSINWWMFSKLFNVFI